MASRKLSLEAVLYVPGLLLLAYVLSAGPVLHYSFQRCYWTAYKFYEPVFGLDRTPLRPVFWGYMKLWGFYPGAAYGRVIGNPPNTRPYTAYLTAHAAPPSGASRSMSVFWRV